MKFLSFKLTLQVLQCNNIKKFLNDSKNHLSPSLNNAKAALNTQTVIVRPKELDKLRKQAREREEKEKGEYKQYTVSTEGISLYGYFLLSIPLLTFGLGAWQVERRKWKVNLIKDLEERLSRPPIEMPENLDELSQLEYCPIKVKGKFLYDKEFVVGPRSLIINGHGANEGKGSLISSSASNRGYVVITPFKLEARDLVILVNRGWLPNKYKHDEERKVCQVEGTVEITGINRLNERRPQFVPKNEPEKGAWHYRNLYEMAEFANAEPIFLDMIESNTAPGMPIGAQTRVNLRNEHLSYIITWFGLSAFTGFYWFRQHILKKPIF